MWSSGIRVLLVEDDKELGDMIKRVLSVEGYEGKCQLLASVD
jgi:DNA-binding response OmpR family regulator